MHNLHRHKFDPFLRLATRNHLMKYTYISSPKAHKMLHYNIAVTIHTDVAKFEELRNCGKVL